jgi:hypothetical protein
MGHITQRARNKKSRRHLKLLFDRILSIGEADMRRVMALQLADLYAWCISHKTAKHRRKWHNRILNQRKWIDDHYGYDAIVKVNETMVELTKSWSLPPTRATR